MSDHPTPFAPKKKQAGPTLLSERSCYGCMYEESAPYRVQGDSGREVYCTAGVARRLVGDTSWTTPDWCPLLASDSLIIVGGDSTALATPLVEEPVAHVPSDWHTAHGGELVRREPTAVESPEVAELWRRCEAADREVTALRQLLAQGRPVTDADLARVSGLIRGEARGVWLGRPPTDEEVAAHVREHGADAVWVSACHNGSVWVSSAVGVYPLSLGDLGADLTVIDAAPAVGRADAERLGRERMEREKAKRP